MTRARTEISKLTIDPALQQRGPGDNEGLTDLKVVGNYARMMKEGDVFPPVKAIWDFERLLVYDGFHRIEAALEAGQTEIDVEWSDGSFDEALILSYGANGIHGLDRTDERKNAIVRAALANPLLEGKSDREIGRVCRVSHGFVGDVKKRLAEELLPKATKRNRGVEDPSAGTSYKPGKPGPKKGGKKQVDSESTLVRNEAGDLVTPLQQSEERRQGLIDEVTELRLRIAEVATSATEEEKGMLVEAVNQLRQQAKADAAELKTLRALRVADTREKTELKKQIQLLERKIKKLEK